MLAVLIKGHWTLVICFASFNCQLPCELVNYKIHFGTIRGPIKKYYA